MYSLRSKTSPFPCNAAAPLWIPRPPPFPKHSTLPLHESASVPHLLAGRPPGLLDYRQLNGERREPPPQEEPPEPEADPPPRGRNREMATREGLPPQAGHAS